MPAFPRTTKRNLVGPFGLVPDISLELLEEERSRRAAPHPNSGPLRWQIFEPLGCRTGDRWPSVHHIDRAHADPPTDSARVEAKEL